MCFAILCLPHKECSVVSPASYWKPREVSRPRIRILQGCQSRLERYICRVLTRLERRSSPLLVPTLITEQCLWLISTSSLTIMSISPIIYMIRHGEKPPNDGIGLNKAGSWRSEQLPGVFGSGSSYDIKYILAEKPKKGTKPISNTLSIPSAPSLLAP